MSDLTGKAPAGLVVWFTTATRGQKGGSERGGTGLVDRAAVSSSALLYAGNSSESSKPSRAWTRPKFHVYRDVKPQHAHCENLPAWAPHGRDMASEAMKRTNTLSRRVGVRCGVAALLMSSASRSLVRSSCRLVPARTTDVHRGGADNVDGRGV